MGAHACPRDVHVYAVSLLIGPERGDLEVRGLLEQPCKIVGVGDAHVALPGGDRFQNLSVAVDIGWVVGDPPPDYLFDCRFPLLLDERAEQRLVVGVARRAEAESSFPLRIPESGVGGQLIRLHPGGAVHDRPGPYGEAEPAVLRIT